MRGMTGPTLAAVLATAALSVPGVALADGWSITDLGPVSTRDECMRRAEAVIQAVPPGQRGYVSSSSWNVFAYDMKPGDNDVVITCPIVAGQVNAFAFVYGDDGSSEDQRIAMKDYIKARF